MELGLNYYQILQVRFNAEKSDIMAAYRRLSKIYHPDISLLPNANEMMAKINLAYDTLYDDKKRKAYNNSHFALVADDAKSIVDQAQVALSSYFDALLSNDYHRAYRLLCLNDKKYVTLSSFIKWRQAVRELYTMREFKISNGKYIDDFAMENKRKVAAISFDVNVIERDYASGRNEYYSFSKYVTFENGQAGVYLGYRDLHEIARNIESLVRKREKGLMEEHWHKHWQNTDRLSGLLSKEGLLIEAKTEIYRSQRYKRQITIARLKLQPPNLLAQNQIDLATEAVGLLIKKSLRLTDTAAHLGNGTYIILFSELKKRHANHIIGRLAHKMEQTANAAGKATFSCNYDFEPYKQGSLDSYLR